MAEDFEDNSLIIINHDDFSKKMKFDLSALNTGTLVTFKMPAFAAASITPATLEQPNEYASYATFVDGSGGVNLRKQQSVHFWDATDVFSTDLYGQGTASREVALPDASGTLPLLEVAQTFTQPQNFDDTAHASAPLKLTLGDITSNVEFLRIVDSASGFVSRWSVDFSLSADRDISLPDASGQLALLPGGAQAVNLTSQGADIGTTTLTSKVGMHRVGYVLADTTGDVAAGVLTLTLTWTDDVGAATSSATRTMATTGRTAGSVDLYLASGNLTYAITHTGIFGSAQYALRIRAVPLG